MSELPQYRLRLQRTNGGNPDFISLVRQLDNYLNEVFGEEQKTFDNYNKVGEGGKVVIAYQAEIAVGCGCLREVNADTVELKRMYVPEEFRGSGVATVVLLEMEKWAAELGYREIILETGTPMTEAIKLYEKHNYRVCEKFGPYVNSERSICFRKQIGEKKK